MLGYISEPNRRVLFISILFIFKYYSNTDYSLTLDIYHFFFPKKDCTLIKFDQKNTKAFFRRQTVYSLFTAERAEK